MARVFVLGSLAESLIRFRGHLLRELVRQGHEVYACAPDDSADVVDTLSSWNVKFVRVNMERTGMNPVRDLATLRELVAMLRRIRPDVFFGYTVKPVIYGCLAARIAGVPRIAPMITGITHAFLGRSPSQRVLGAIAFSLFKLALARSHCVFFQNPDDLQDFIERRLLPDPSRAVLVNGSGVDTEEFSPTPLPKHLSFLLIARLIRDKGVYEYVEAARQVKARYPEVMFRLVGWFDDKPTSISRKQLAQWVDDGIVEYLGVLRDVRPAISDASVYVLPSYREGTPRTVLEAAAMGRPCITTDTPGCRGTVRDNETGFLVPIRDANAVASAMERFVTEPELIPTMGDAARTYAVEKYDVRSVTAELIRGMLS